MPLQRTLHVPWLQIFKCVPLYALAVAHFTCNIGYYTLLTTLPTYFGNILAFDMKSVSLSTYFLILRSHSKLFVRIWLFKVVQ